MATAQTPLTTRRLEGPQSHGVGSGLPPGRGVLSTLRSDGRTKPVMNSLTAKYPSAVGVSSRVGPLRKT